MSVEPGELHDVPAATLSGGQQQMLAIARALMARPKLLVCDEISLGLAPIVVDALYDAIGAIRERGIAVMLVEQNVYRSLSVAEYAYVFHRGQVTYAGEPAHAFDDRRLRAAYFGPGEPVSSDRREAAGSTAMDTR